MENTWSSQKRVFSCWWHPVSYQNSSTKNTTGAGSTVQQSVSLHKVLQELAVITRLALQKTRAFRKLSPLEVRNLVKRFAQLDIPGMHQFDQIRVVGLQVQIA